MSLPDERSSYMKPSSPIGRTQSGLAALFVTPSPKKTEGRANQAVDNEPYINKRKSSRVVNDKPFVDERKPLTMTAVKVNLHNGEHTLIPVTVKMIHSAVRDCERFVLKDG